MHDITKAVWYMNHKIIFDIFPAHSMVFSCLEEMTILEKIGKQSGTCSVFLEYR